MRPADAFVCKKHGSEGLLIEECEPTSPHNFVVKCKKCRKPYKGWANAKQVEDLLRAYPDCDAREY
jgi:hypothetical protein